MQLETSSASHEKKDVPVREIPRVQDHPILGSTITFQKDQVGFVTKLHEQHGDVVKARIVLDNWVFCRDPEIIHEINVRQWEKFQKPKLAKTLWKLFLGDGLVPNDGESWRRQHDMIKVGFHRHRIESYGPAMVEHTERMLRRYKQGERRDVREEINNLALAIVGQTLFNANLEGDTNVVYEAMHDVSEILVEHINMPLPTPRWWPSRGNRRKMGAIEAIEGVIKRLIAERKAQGADQGDLLSTIVFARDEHGEPMSQKQMRDEAMTLIFAGHETTAHAMTWAWYLLATHPEVVSKMHAEIASVVGDRSVTVADLEKMPYLLQVVKESLRRLPSVWTYMREPMEDVVIKGYRFKKGEPIFISPLVLGRDARIHPDPLAFKPERWTKEYERGLPKGAFVPFAAGPRVCLGQGFAMMEMRLILATMVQNLIPTVPAGFSPDFVTELSMHPGKKGIPIDVVFRDDAPVLRRS